jgi:hypothetical protein
MARNFINLSEIVNDFLLTRDEDDYDKSSNFIQLMTWGKQAIRSEISFDLRASLKTATIDIDQTLGIAELPSDYIDYAKIGAISNDCKNVISLGVNKSLNMAELPEGSCHPQMRGGNSILWGDWLYFSGALKNGGLYGIGGGNNSYGYYRINTDLNRIELDVSLDSEFIVLEYLADESEAEDPKVPAVAEQFVINWLYYKSIKRKMNVPQGAIAEAERRVYLEKKKANYRIRMFTKAEAAAQINRRFQLSPKFMTEGGGGMGFGSNTGSMSSGNPFSTGDAFFTFTQLVPANTWVILHNLGKKPSVTVVDESDTVVVGIITYNNLNQLTITFSTSFAGKAYLN